MKRKLAVISGLFFCSILSFGAQYQWLTFRMTDSSELSVDAENLVIRYSNGNLEMKSSTVDKLIAVTDIESMEFSSTPSSIEEIFIPGNQMISLYTLSGIKAGDFKSIEDARANLSHGTYIFETPGGKKKIIF